MRQVLYRNQNGICPACGDPLYMFVSTYQVIGMNQYGLPNKEIDWSTSFMAICNKCGYKHPIQKTDTGLIPVPVRIDGLNNQPKVQLEVPNSVGIVEEE